MVEAQFVAPRAAARAASAASVAGLPPIPATTVKLAASTVPGRGAGEGREHARRRRRCRAAPRRRRRARMCAGSTPDVGAEAVRRRGSACSSTWKPAGAAARTAATAASWSVRATSPRQAQGGGGEVRAEQLLDRRPIPPRAAVPARQTGSSAAPDRGRSVVGVDARAPRSRPAGRRRSRATSDTGRVAQADTARSCRGRADGRGRTSRRTPARCRARRAGRRPRPPGRRQVRAHVGLRDAGRPGVAVAVGVDDRGVRMLRAEAGVVREHHPACGRRDRPRASASAASPYASSAATQHLRVRAAGRGPPSAPGPGG